MNPLLRFLGEPPVFCVLRAGLCEHVLAALRRAEQLDAKRTYVQLIGGIR